MRKRPERFKLPDSKVLVGVAKTMPSTDGGHRYFQLYSGGSYDPKTAERLGKWLIRTAKWMRQTKPGSGA